jgi:lipoprotein signal peptidase
MKVCAKQAVFLLTLLGIFLLGFQLLHPSITGGAVIDFQQAGEKSSLMQVGILFLFAAAIGQVIDKI